MRPLVWVAPSLTMNPTIDLSIIGAAYEADPVAAASEYGAEFRDLVGAFIAREVLDQAMRGDLTVSIDPGTAYVLVLDVAGGSGSDSFALAVAHVEAGDDTTRIVVDFVEAQVPPFNPVAVLREVQGIAQEIGVTTLYGDRASFAWVELECRALGLAYQPIASTTSQNFLTLLALLNSGKVSLPPHDGLIRQLAGLQRKITPAGTEVVEHAGGHHDDLAAAVAGAVAVAYRTPVRGPLIFW